MPVSECVHGKKKGRNALDLSLETLFFFGRKLDVAGVLGVQLCALSE